MHVLDQSAEWFVYLCWWKQQYRRNDFGRVLMDSFKPRNLGYVFQHERDGKRNGYLHSGGQYEHGFPQHDINRCGPTLRRAANWRGLHVFDQPFQH